MSELIIPQIVIDNELQERQRIWKEKHDSRFRQVLRKAFSLIKEELESFEQTTHAALKIGEGIDPVVRDLEAAYKDPRAYTISSLSQSIDRFLKETA